MVKILPVFNTRAGFHHFEFGRNTTNTTIHNIVQINQRCVTNQLQNQTKTKHIITNNNTFFTIKKKKKITSVTSLAIFPSAIINFRYVTVNQNESSY